MENAKAPPPPPPPGAPRTSAVPPPPPAAAKKDGEGAPQQPEEQLPKRFGKYTLLRKLAMGGMAEIYLALQRSVAGFEKLIVVKRVLPNLAKDTAFVTMLLDEARIAATLNHPNIAQVFDAGVVDGQYYIAMEHVHGEDLRSIVRGMKTKNVSAFPLEHALAITLGMTAGLAYAHEQRTLDGEPMNIVHRDVSPQNVLVTFNGDVKLVDFGIAKAGRSKEEETKSDGGKLKGKVPYMSPEQAQGQDLDARSDIFAVGVMLFELTTGRRLFRGANEFETLKMIVEQEYPSPRSINPNIAPRLEQIIQTALAKNRENRFQTARELQAALEEYIRSEKLAVSPLSLGEWMQMLFAEKLSAQKQMLMEGRQLADVLAQQAADEAEAERQSQTLSGVRARRATRVPLIVAAVVVVLAIAAAGIAIKVFGGAGAPRGPGVIAITSDPAGATVWIDGDQRPQRTPATITGLPVGQRHSVKLTRDGYAPFTETVELTQQRQRGSVSAHLVLPTASMFGVLRVDTTPSAAHVLLDGRDTGKVTPTTVDGIAPGETHTVTVSLDGWVTKSDRFTLQAGQVQDVRWTLDRTPLAANESLAHVVVEPRDARFTFDGQLRTDGPPFDIRTTARTVHVSVRKDGFVTQERDVPLTGGQVVNLEFRLERNREPHHGHDTPPAGGGPPGTLTFDARPWCNVQIDGASVGQTPIVNRSLSAGHHRVTCTNPELGVTRTVQVDIVSGQPTRQRLQLQ